MGGTGSDQGNSITADGSGNVYTTGGFRLTGDFDPGAGIANLSSAGGWDAFIQKLDRFGNLAWAKRIGGSDHDWGTSIKVDGSRNVYTTGYFEGTADFDPSGATENLISAGGSDAYVQKLDSFGNLLWAKKFGGTDDVSGMSLAIDGSGYIYTAGFFRGTVDFDPNAGTANLTSAGDEDVFVQKMDPSGNFVWAKQMGGVSRDIARSIAVDVSGNVYITGYFEDTGDFDPGGGTANLTSAGRDDIFVQKLDSSGNYIWAKQMGGTGDDNGISITVDGSGNVYTTGDFEGTADFDPGAGALISEGASDVFAQKLDGSGNSLWVKSFGGINPDKGYSIGVDTDGNVYTTGWFAETVDFDPGVGIANMTSAGEEDIFIQKLDGSGNLIRTKRIGGISRDFGFSIMIDGPGNVYATGEFAETVDFDPSSGIVNVTSTGGYNVFVLKMSPGSIGIPENNFGDNITIYPNPTDGVFSIDLGAIYEEIIVTITDIHGKVIEKSNYNQSHLRNLKIEAPSGAYFLMISSQKEHVLIKLIKE